MPGRGSGLGLPIVRAIVKQSGGHFSIQSKPGCGTTVDMWLPVAEEVGAIGVAA
nr:ATP-binding protein [Bradyrhizobium sp. 186]